ncbi:MAG: BrnT family toxin [Xanthomonadaceae bacterium]|nr:BrnT family toxin [Xanthomonadaceae bacterium]
MDKDLSGCEGFEWDAGNAEKSWRKHGVSRSECEQVFFNRPLLVADDEKHSEDEKRYYALGVTDTGRHLFQVFTIRGVWIRVISARDMSRRERLIYEEKGNSEIQD